MTYRIAALVGVCTGLAAFPSAAQLACDKSYGIRVDVNAIPGGTVCSSSMWRFLDGIRNFQLSNSAYTSRSQASVAGRLNDVNVLMGYPANSKTLHFNFVELGESGSFTGTTRRESQRQFEDYVKNNDIMGRIMNYQSKGSPTSPITGAGGLMPMTIASDFSSSFNGSPTAVAGPQAAGESSNNLVGVGLGYGSYNLSATNERVSTLTIPLSYTIRNEIDPRRQLHFSVPVTLIELDGTRTITGGFGVSYRFPMSDHWTVTPGARYGVVASTDRATIAAVYSASIMSTYVIELSGFDLSIGNMLGYYATGRFSAGDYSLNPGISTVATRNGVMLSQPVTLAGKTLTAEYSLSNTSYLGGDQPFFDNFWEATVTVGTNKGAVDARSFVRGGVSYLQGPGTRGLALNLGYWF